MNMFDICAESSRCLLCHNAPCDVFCKHHLQPARAIRAIRFDNKTNASKWLSDACVNCDAPCEKHCIHSDKPIQINRIAKTVISKYSNLPDIDDIDLSVDFCGVRCENPFFLASSAICTNYEMVARAFDQGWGGVVFKTIGLDEIQEVSPRFDAVRNHSGQPFFGFRNMEQISELSADENFGILRRLKQNYPSKIIVASIMGQTDNEWITLAKRAEKSGADIIELNFSCPQMKKSGMGSDVGQNVRLVKKLTEAVKQNVGRPVIAKMTPNITDICKPALASYSGGADGIAAINTIKSVTLSESALVSGKRTISGYSGKAVKPIALRFILDIATDPKIRRAGKDLQISGIGGIETWRDALDFIQLGCRNVQVCTAVMQYGYRIIDDLVLGMKTYMSQKGVKDISELVGSELPSFGKPGDLDRSTKVFPRWDREVCVGCGRCYLACSDAGHQAIVFDEKRTPRLIGANCAGCHLCRLVCPTGAILTSNRM